MTHGKTYIHVPVQEFVSYFHTFGAENIRKLPLRIRNAAASKRLQDLCRFSLGKLRYSMRFECGWLYFLFSTREGESGVYERRSRCVTKAPQRRCISATVNSFFILEESFLLSHFQTLFHFKENKRQFNLINQL